MRVRILKREPIFLTRRESLRLIEVIERPPARNELFKAAQARYQQRKQEGERR